MLTKIKSKTAILLFLCASFFVITAEDCGGKPEARQKGVQTQERSMNKAVKNVPVPEMENFTTRKTVAKWMKTMDDPSKTFYIYLLANNGSKVGYYVAQTRPVSVGTYMTPTQKEYEVDGQPHPVGPAPSLDGTYAGMNGGAGSQFYFFEAGTGAYMEIKGLNYLVSDQPMNVDAPRLTVEANVKSGEPEKSE